MRSQRPKDERWSTKGHVQTVGLEIFNFEENENVVASIDLLVNGACEPQGRPGNIEVILFTGKSLYAVEAL